MFHTEKFIAEVQQRECLWNVTAAGYIDRYTKRQAWEEIGAVMFDDWAELGPHEKHDKVEEISKKWRNLRDYFMKEKRKDIFSHTSTGKKKKKYYYYDALSFLEAVAKSFKPDDSQADAATAASFEESIEDSCDPLAYMDTNLVYSPEESTHLAEGKTSSNGKKTTAAKDLMTPFEEQLLSKLEKPQLNDPIVEANRNFLLSLLPHITSMSEKQNLQFRLGVLNLINSIKFEQNHEMQHEWS